MTMQIKSRPSDEADLIRMLGCWLGSKEDVKNRIKRAGYLWAKCRPRLLKSKLPRRKQAQIVEACAESVLLFDCAVRPWYNSEIKRMQSWIDKRLRYIWSNKKGPPLIQMQMQGKNMQDIRNILNVKTLRWKIEKRTLERIGHVLRMNDSRTTKVAVLGRLSTLEEEPKRPGKKKKTLFYWKKLLTEAGINWTEAGALAANRKEWKKIIYKRMAHLETWERQQAHNHNLEEIVDERNWQAPQTNLQCVECGKTCRSVGGLKVHIKRIHQRPTHSFVCEKCGQSFSTESTWKNHVKKCNPTVAVGPRVYVPRWDDCEFCGQELSATNMARHQKRCGRGHAPSGANP